MNRLLLWLTAHLGIVTSVYRNAFLLGLRSPSAISGIELTRKDAGTASAIDLFAVIASALTILELVIFLVSGNTLPIPSVLIGVLFEGVILVCFVAIPSIAIEGELRSRGIGVSFRSIFICANYVYIAYLLWTVLLLSPAMLIGAAFLTAAAAKILTFFVRLFIFVNWILLLAHVLKAKGIVPRDAKDLFYSFITRMIFITMLVAGGIGLSFEAATEAIHWYRKHQEAPH